MISSNIQLSLIARLDGGPPPLPVFNVVPNMIALAVTVAIGFAIFHVFVFIIGSQLRRGERIRAFLEAVVAFHDAGLPVEEKLVELATINIKPPVPSSWWRELIWPRNNNRPPYQHPFGSRFRKLVEHLQQGMPLDQALEYEHHFLPPALRRSLMIGLETGDLDSLRSMLKDPLPGATSRAVGMANYFLLPTFLFGVIIMGGFLHFIAPKFQKMILEMCGKELPMHGLFFMLHDFKVFAVVPCLAVISMVLGVVLHIWGWRLMSNASWNSVGSLVFYYLLPWRRLRMTAAFSKQLLILLKAGMDEKDALMEAALSTDNRVMARRALKGIKRLEAGDSLLTVLTAEFDKGGELSWRLANLLKDKSANSQFAKSLDGWCSYLDARAFRLEQATGQVISTALISVTSVLTCLLAFGIFRSLTLLLDNMVLW